MGCIAQVTMWKASLAIYRSYNLSALPVEQWIVDGTADVDVTAERS